MLFRAVVVWGGLLLLAILNGGIREGVWTPRFGAGAGHVISTIVLSILILAATGLTLPWIGIERRSEAWRIGGMWMALTLIFEIAFGRAAGRSWGELLADYDLSRGRIWILIPIVTGLAPFIAGRLCGLLR